ncbi:MAG: hypothetical protein H6537_08545 [Bacteroidales bacterium]|nr:hypothetical protein [Bacteroidales bacterium]HPD95058.1 hypothetical protein [Tenuifilaceae bacterium]HRX30372.1 hypothetical protein [Tenuifilaceae bacterium]
MKKNLLLTAAVLIGFAVNGYSQNTFVKNDKVLNFGIGIGNTLYSGSGYTSKTPPLSVSFEMGVKDQLFDEKSSLGIGGYIGYSGAKWEYYDWGWKYSNFIIGVRGIGHYQLLNKVDTYTGIMIGYDVVNASEFGTTYGTATYSATSSGIVWSWFAGGRYYFNDKFAAFAEIGYGIAYLNLGLTMKF